MTSAPQMRRVPGWFTRGLVGEASGSEDLVEDRLGLVLVRVLGQRQLGDEDLARLGQHPLLAGREAAVTLAAPQVADDLRHLHDVAAVQLLEIGLVATRPVGRLLDVRGTEDVEHTVETLLVDNVTNPDQVEVAGRNSYDQVLLGDDPQNEVLPVLSLDLPHLDVLDDCGPVIWIDDRFADGESHVSGTPS